MDYRKYRLNRREIILYSARALGLTGILAFCFYNSVWACLIFPLLLPLYMKEQKGVLAGKRRKELKLQFKAAVQGIAAALSAGYSAENALREAGKDLRMMYSSDVPMVQELAAMQRKLDANQTLEDVLADFAERSGLEEAQTFSEIFTAAKRNGGDLIGIMKDTARTISETVETERQIAMVLASRRYEQKIMNKIPFAMILYLRVGCSGFLDPMYGNPAGILIMTGCLGLYAGSWYLGKRLLEIEV